MKLFPGSSNKLVQQIELSIAYNKLLCIRPNDKILVAFSGGQGCLAVLKLIRNSLDDENNPKKVAYFPTVFIMDESGISEDNFEFSEVLELAKMFDFPIFVAHLSMVLKSGEESEGKVVTESTNYLSTSDLNNEGKLDAIVF